MPSEHPERDGEDMYDIAKRITEEHFGPGSWTDPRPARRRFHMAFGQRTLNDLDPREAQRSTQHIPQHVVKRVGSRYLEVLTYQDVVAASQALDTLLPDDTVEGVQPSCMHVCLN